MKYPYSSPNLHILDIFSALLLSNKKSEKRIKSYFSELTNKKYVLITNSCRSALYIAYKTLGVKGEVITSPLTCKVAIDPIIESGNEPVYADISTSDLNINPDDISHRVNKSTIAIQVIHTGGIACDMERIMEIASKNNLYVIEDCAQSLGAIYRNKYTGEFGDISCYSLIKNAYGIGGGIFATNNYEHYEKASQFNTNLKKQSFKLLVYRIIRNVVDTKRRYYFFRKLFNILLKLKGKKKSYRTVREQLRQVTLVEKKIVARQIKKYPDLHRKRKYVGNKYINELKKLNIIKNNSHNHADSSFTKLFVYNSDIDVIKYLSLLKNEGIEAMHLEHSWGSPYQERLVSEEQATKLGLINYNKVHDSIISLPVTEYYTNEDIDFICKALREINDK